MRLTVMTDYALRLLVYVAKRPDRRCTIVEVAQAHGISEAHLMKVTHQLGIYGWILTARGRGGGIRLARPPGEIRLGEVVRSMETDFRLAECFGPGSACALTGDCRLAGMIDEALQAFFRSLDSRTLAQIVAAAPTPPTPPGPEATCCALLEASAAPPAPSRTPSRERPFRH